ncbi:leucine carboxyl methyltransferase [Plenodomus tracheiphilus IPT5]|uniref:Leucine carboxyl methyltransferase 1 n=1 Tax=Plenodomus tracheiphilus IPT5 TaxID=1408161 RepID=A0A6A7BEQ4_9PLEO|nr:leucine carboxyl methyltransferase [Plenodomus tracheiphilus IPT5]
MASSTDIPDLRTLLGQRRGGAQRGRGRGGGALGTTSAGNEQVRDNAVKGTDQDAAGSRVSCVELGYLHDPYAKLFATQQTVRRLPLLNRGTYVRTSAIDLLVAKFLDTNPSSTKQIISLGAGTDTRFFRLLDLYPQTRLVYHEIDFASNTVSKIAAIQKHRLLYEKLEHMPNAADTYHSTTYNIHALDLRSLAAASQDTPPPNLPNLDPTLPTLLLSEMCLIYLQPRVVQSIIQSLLTHYLQPTTPASLILYEPILPQDAFGRTMITNLQSRNIHLPTLTSYPELGDQRARLQGYGFKAGAKATDTSFIWRNWTSEDEKERVGSLEFLDELEELELLLRHYCVAWGWRNGDSDVFAKAWSGVREQ